VEEGAPPAARLAAWVDGRRRALWAFVALALAAIALLWIAIQTLGPMPGDRAAIGLRTHTTTLPAHVYRLAEELGRLGEPGVAVLTIAVAAVAVAATSGRRWGAIVVAAGCVVGASSALKAVLGAPPLTREVLHNDIAGFPSGHTAYATALFGALAVLQLARGRRAAAALAALVVVLMGPARVLQGAHWPSDVVSGYLLGTAWLAVVLLVGARWASAPDAPTSRRAAP
jgi:membrane-associated phospholipid phosphatase